MEKLKDLIRSARSRCDLSQDQLAEQVQISKQWMNRIEAGERLPSIDLTIKFHQVLSAADDDCPPLIHWLLARVVEEKELPDERRALVQEAAADVFARQSEGRFATLTGPPRSLADFPRTFYPLTIVCGDRRESSPRTRGDIFAYSMSTTDLMFLPHLKLDSTVDIRSDKLFVLMDEEYLQRKFGQTNLLIIGSPAVNLLARLVNKTAIFQFDPATDIAVWERWERYVNANKLLNDRRYLQAFWELAEALPSARGHTSMDEDLPAQELSELKNIVIQLLDGSTPKDLMNKFRKPGIMDPADNCVQAQTTRSDNDFAVISVARNPFADSDDYLAIIAAGIHGPGTAHAVRVLAQEDNNISLQDHPLGGVLEIELDAFKDWPTRFEKATCRWQTRRYTTAQIQANLEDALRQDTSRQRGPLARLGKDTLAGQLDLVKHLASKGF